MAAIFGRRGLLSLLLLGAQPCVASFVSTLPAGAQDMFNQSMSWLDTLYDPDAHYLYDVSQGTQTSLNHETRASAWYAIGLLARNSGSDVDEAMHIIKNVIAGQFKNPQDQWYGTYQKSPEEPTVGTAAYPADIYNSWDPNWRGFIGTAFIQGLEDFPHLITPEVTALMLESLRNNTIGDSYRVGGVDGDNLYPAYSNPSIMRAFVSGWTGRRLNDANMTAAGESYAQDVVDLFDRADTLSEFNSGTYAGVSLYALSLWARYMPSNSSVMGAQGPRMLRATWSSVTSLYHARLRNSAGPWDRTYGYDMTRYLSILALHIWNLVGRAASPLLPSAPPYAMGHSADYAYAPLLALMAPSHNALVPAAAVQRLTHFPGPHLVRTSAFSPPYDAHPRNITAWLADRITLGASTFDEAAVGGPALNPDTWSPAVVQWDASSSSSSSSSSSNHSSSNTSSSAATTAPEIGWLKWYATEPALLADVRAPGILNLTYPRGDASSIFSFMVSPAKGVPDVAGWEDVKGVRVSVIGGNVNATCAVAYYGPYGGAGGTVK
ncbi:uncharacterized protein BKCO1_6300031 [Diplodia corticola]|uniref:Uncharacterized protein n=1 Tax=Diplodia corticola TaxID=236234 RepID=A0A1J9QN27_9PEZI|nr:uncharacterized protein BKCO1_6300031 [Diplodia corticola]OJD30294.1 hypothetical protein BKCO1_6300031 [Diplodia corticola]